jgi:hypothetical protein
MKKAFCAFAVCAFAVLSMAATASANGGGGHSSSQTCNGTFTGVTINANVVVPDYGACTLIDSTVNGSVTVKKKAYFEAGNTHISGGIFALFSQTVYLHDGSSSGSITAWLTRQVFLFDSSSKSINVIGTPASDGQVNVCGMGVTGDVNILFSGSDILVGDPLTVGCAGNNVSDDVNVSANYVQVELVIRGNTVGDDMWVLYNRGPAAKNVEANVGGDKLVCKGNSSPFVAAANVGWNAKYGQCSGP